MHTKIVKKWFEGKSSKQIYQEILDLGKENTIESVEMLKKLLLVRDNHTYDKFVVPSLVCRSLLLTNRPFDILREVIYQIESRIYFNTIIEFLWFVKNNRLPERVFLAGADLEEIGYYEIEISESHIVDANDLFFEIVQMSQSDQELFDSFIFFVGGASLRMIRDDEVIDFQKDFFEIITESTLRITNKKINQFRKMINAKLREEGYQMFFKENPIFLSPMNSKFISKEKLGTEFITDFVLESLSGEYKVVEIEKPTDKIFTRSGEFTSSFFHAFGQVIDFLQWLEDNISYAQKNLPFIASPKGILIMGLRTDFDEKCARRLKKFNDNSVNVEVLTYDDVLHMAELLYGNLKSKG